MTKITRRRLANGLTVLTEEIHDAPVVALQAWVNVGGADEDDSILGVAHLHEHMLFKGTRRRGVGEIARTVEASGGEINAWTSFDQTVYHVVLAANEVETGVDILADALQNSSFDADELGREIEVVVEEIKRAQDAPSRRISNALFALAYSKHPYRRPVLGTETTVRGLGRDRILGFFQRHYRPDQVTFVAVGDFRPDDLQGMVERHFGSWAASSKATKPERAVEPVQNDIRVQILSEPVKEARLALAWQAPGLHHDDIAAIDALTVILGHGDSSRLYNETRRGQELVNDVYAYAYTPRDPGLIMVGAGLRVENLQAALTSLLAETYRFRQHLVSEDELEKAKVLILSESAYQRETVQGQARKLGFFEVVGGDYNFEQQYLEALRRIGPEDLRRVANTYLHGAPCLVAQIPEQAEQPAPVDVAGLTKVIQTAFAKAVAEPRAVRLHGPLGVERIKLPNGAVILVREEDSPVVAIRAVALGGQRWESRAKSGLGNLFASLWGLATEELGPQALAQKVALLGGSISAFSGRNTVGLRGEFIREKADEGLQLFLTALLRPVFDPADLERERAVVLERIRNRDDNPGAVAFDLFAENLYPTHSYGLRLSGSEESVAGITLADLLAHRALYTSPDKMVISVVGGMSAQRALDMLTGSLDHPAGAALPAPPRPDAPPAGVRKVHHPIDRKQSHVIVGAMGTTLYDRERFALEVLTTILSGQSGRLFLDLRDKQSLAYSVSSGSLEGLDPGHIMTHMGTAPDKVAQALAGLYGHLARLRQERVDPTELSRAQRYLVGAHAIDLQRGGARGMLMALNELYGQGYDEHTRYAENVRAVTVDQVQEVANKYLRPDSLIEIVVGA